MKNTLKFTSIAILVLLLFFTSCKKDKVVDTSVEVDESASFSLQSADVNTTNNCSDMSFEDAENVLSQSSLSGAKTASFTGICGATIDTSFIKSDKKIIITYNGNTCDGLSNRTGTVTIQLTIGNKWKDLGSVLIMTYAKFRVTNLSTNKYLTLNGEYELTNETGGIIANIGISPNPTTIIRTVKANNIAVTFDNAAVRIWSISRQKTWTGSSGKVTSLSIDGNEDLANVTKTEAWGTNRLGHYFTTVMNIPLVLNSTCGWFSPISGKKTHTFSNRVSTITFGTDVSGNVIPNGCPNHYIVNWNSPKGNAKYYIGTD